MQRTPAHPAALDLPPGLTLLGELFAVIADIRQTLDAGTPDAAKLAAIAGYLDERAPAPRMDPDQAAALIARQRGRRAPLPGHPVILVVPGDRDIRLSA